MRVPINLARQPYENLRPWYNAAALAATLLLALALLVVWHDWQNRRETRLLTEQSNRLEESLGGLQQQQREMEDWLRRPEVQEIRDRSDYLNSLIVRKSLSWTRMFMDLEQILPARARVTAIQPSLNQSRQVELNLSVAAVRLGPLVEFLKNLESASQFGSPEVHSQRVLTGRGAEGHIVLDVTVLYYQAFPGQPSSEKTAADSPAAALADASPGGRRTEGK